MVYCLTDISELAEQMQLGSTVCCSFLSSCCYPRRVAVRFSLSLVPTPCQPQGGGEAPGGRVICPWASVGTLSLGSSWCLAGLRWDMSCCCSTAGTAAPGSRGVILVVDVSFLWTQQSWHQGGPSTLRSALLVGEKSLLVPMDLCKEKKSRIWVALVFTGGNCSFLWSFAGSLWAHWYTVGASERGGKKMAVVVQICLEEVIENKLLPKAKGCS